MQSVSQEGFHEIDYLVMKHVFDVQNELGRFYDEVIYCNELARRCKDTRTGRVETEVPVTVVHKDFRKTYFLDLLINRSVVYELKTAQTIDSNHRRQLLNYLFLCLLHHGKLVNFRTPRVTHEFVSTSLDAAQRYVYKLNLTDWQEVDSESKQLKQIMEELLADWGVFLEATLYSEALVHFFGGADRVEVPVEVRPDTIPVGRQRFKMLNEDTAFFVTAIQYKTDYRKYLKTLLGNTSISCAQWVNFDKHDVEFVTVR
jgi:GxxExxY protein